MKEQDDHKGQDGVRDQLHSGEVGCHEVVILHGPTGQLVVQTILIVQVHNVIDMQVLEG